MINTPMAELMRHTCANDLYEELYNIFMDYKDIIAIGWDTKGYSSNVYILTKKECNKIIKNNNSIFNLDFKQQVLFAMINSYTTLADYCNESCEIDTLLFIKVLDEYKTFDVSDENIFECFARTGNDIVYIQNSTYKD